MGSDAVMPAASFTASLGFTTHLASPLDLAPAQVQRATCAGTTPAFCGLAITVPSFALLTLRAGLDRGKQREAYNNSLYPVLLGVVILFLDPGGIGYQTRPDPQVRKTGLRAQHPAKESVYTQVMGIQTQRFLGLTPSNRDRQVRDISLPSPM